MQSASVKRQELAAAIEAGYQESWQQIVKSAAESEDSTLFRLVATVACSRRLVHTLQRRHIKKLFLVEGSYQLTAYNIVAAAVQKFSLYAKGRAYQQWCKREGIALGEMTGILASVAALHADHGYAIPESHEFCPIRGDSREAWLFIDHLLGSHGLRLLHQGYHDAVGAITIKGKIPGLDGMAIGEIVPVGITRHRFEGTAVPLELLLNHTTAEVVDLRGPTADGGIRVLVDQVYDNRTIIEKDAVLSIQQLTQATFSSAVRLGYEVVESGLWKSLPDILPHHTRLVAEFNGRHMRGTPAAMREQIRRYLQEQVLHNWHRPPSAIELPHLTIPYPIIRKVVAATIGGDPLTGKPLQAFGTVGLVEPSSQSGPYFGVYWVLDKEVAKKLRADAIAALQPTIARLKQIRRLDHADAVQQAAAVAEVAERLARVSPPIASAETLRELRQLPHPAILFGPQQTREWAKATAAKIETLLKAARIKQQET